MFIYSFSVNYIIIVARWFVFLLIILFIYALCIGAVHKACHAISDKFLPPLVTNPGPTPQTTSHFRTIN